jgi:hypothetical protein
MLLEASPNGVLSDSALIRLRDQDKILEGRDMEGGISAAML